MEMMDVKSNLTRELSAVQGLSVVVGWVLTTSSFCYLVILHVVFT